MRTAILMTGILISDALGNAPSKEVATMYGIACLCMIVMDICSFFKEMGK